MRSVVDYRAQFSSFTRHVVSLIHVLRVAVLIILLSTRLFWTSLHIVVCFIRRYSKSILVLRDGCRRRYYRRCRRRRRHRRRRRRRRRLVVRCQQRELIILVHLRA